MARGSEKKREPTTLSALRRSVQKKRRRKGAIKKRKKETHARPGAPGEKKKKKGSTLRKEEGGVVYSGSEEKREKKERMSKRGRRISDREWETTCGRLTTSIAAGKKKNRYRELADREESSPNSFSPAKSRTHRGRGGTANNLSLEEKEGLYPSEKGGKNSQSR